MSSSRALLEVGIHSLSGSLTLRSGSRGSGRSVGSSILGSSGGGGAMLLIRVGGRIEGGDSHHGMSRSRREERIVGALPLSGSIVSGSLVSSLLSILHLHLLVLVHHFPHGVEIKIRRGERIRHGRRRGGRRGGIHRSRCTGGLVELVRILVEKWRISKVHVRNLRGGLGICSGRRRSGLLRRRGLRSGSSVLAGSCDRGLRFGGVGGCLSRSMVRFSRLGNCLVLRSRLSVGFNIGNVLYGFRRRY